MNEENIRNQKHFHLHLNRIGVKIQIRPLKDRQPTLCFSVPRRRGVDHALRNAFWGHYCRRSALEPYCSHAASSCRHWQCRPHYGRESYHNEVKVSVPSVLGSMSMTRVACQLDAAQYIRTRNLGHNVFQSTLACSFLTVKGQGASFHGGVPLLSP